MADAGSLERGLPRALYDADRTVLVVDEEPLAFPASIQEPEEAVGEGDFAGFALGRFRTGDIDELLGEINIAPELARNLTPAHAGIEGNQGHGVEVIPSHAKKQVFFGEAQDLAVCSSFVFHLETGDGVRN